MRYTIWKKSETYWFGDVEVSLDPMGVEVMSYGRLPVVYAHSIETAIGYMTDVVVDEESISGDITWLDSAFTDDIVNELGLTLSGCFSHAILNDDGNRVVKANLHTAVVQPPPPGFPGAVVNQEETP